MRFFIRCSVDTDTRRRLIEAAHCVAIQSADDAMGKCFLSTIEFACVCSLAKCAELPIIRWKVSGDPDFCEHWAIGISENEVIDLTRVQVDGKTEVLHHINSYPLNYKQIKQYPTAFVLQAYQFLGQDSSAKNLKWAIIKMRWAMFCFDLCNASIYQKISVMMQGFWELNHFTWWLTSSSLSRRLEARRKILQERLNFR